MTHPEWVSLNAWLLHCLEVMASALMIPFILFVYGLAALRPDDYGFEISSIAVSPSQGRVAGHFQSFRCHQGIHPRLPTPPASRG